MLTVKISSTSRDELDKEIYGIHSIKDYIKKEKTVFIIIKDEVRWKRKSEEGRR